MKDMMEKSTVILYHWRRQLNCNQESLTMEFNDIYKWPLSVQKLPQG